MRVLIDECLPRALKDLLVGHDCRTVRERGWSGASNGVLLSLAETEFETLVTIDQGMQYQQNLAGRRLALIVLAARSNQIEDLEPLVSDILTALQHIQPGQLFRVGG